MQRTLDEVRREGLEALRERLHGELAVKPAPETNN